MPTPSMIAFVLAGGEGTRLRPLTDDIPKPALPFADHCRIIDFVLANLRHSGVAPVYVLLQYKPPALLRHLATHWPEVRPLLPARDFLGTADAVAQALRRVDASGADVVAVLAADHVYRMDLRQMAAFHLQHHADVTVAAAVVATSDAGQFGVLDVDADARIVDFQEKPARPAGLKDDPSHALVSMGNYLFEPGRLARALAAAAPGSAFDFGRDVIPALVRGGRAFAYDFRQNAVPGVAATEEPAYWRDVGTLQAYFAAQEDAEGATPRFALDNPAWPISPTLAA